MADRTPTRFNRLQAGENLSTPAAGHVEAFGDTQLSQRMTVSAANTAGNPATRQIAGIFQVDKIGISNTSALTTTSALAVKVGISSNVTAFHEFFVSAGATNEITNVLAASTGARAPNWISTGSAAAVTTVQVAHSAASVRADLSAQVTFNYFVRG